MERALATHEGAYGPERPAVATDFGNVAMVLQDLGEPGPAYPPAFPSNAATRGAFSPALVAQ